MELAPALARGSPDDPRDLEELNAVAARLISLTCSGNWSRKQRIYCLQEVRLLGSVAFVRREPSGFVESLRSNQCRRLQLSCLTGGRLRPVQSDPGLIRCRVQRPLQTPSKEVVAYPMQLVGIMVLS